MAREEQSTKQCRMCFREIDRRARACPYCGNWQGRVQLAVFVPVLLLGFGLGLVAYGEWLGRRLRPDGRAAGAVAYHGQISVTQSEMFKATSADGDIVFVVGKLRNESDVEWEQVGVEAEFFDPQGRLIDVEAEDHYLEHLIPHGEMAFKVRVVADRPLEEYADHKACVDYAKDIRRNPW